jgi:NAD(P)H-dependent flavin oxidoreductase YrpB (nitropropane dioxygenase family)
LGRSLVWQQQEWYELSQKGRITNDNIGQVPDVYIRNEKLEEQIDYLKNELDKAKIVAENAKYFLVEMAYFILFNKEPHMTSYEKKETSIRCITIGFRTKKRN